MDHAFDYIKAHEIGTEKSYAYQATNGSCSDEKRKGERFSVSGYKYLEKPNVTSLAKALNTQPVSVALEVQSSFQRYQSGIYENDFCGSALNHGVLVVAQGQEGGNRFFKIKNSWGASWGEEGFIRIAWGKPNSRGTCGVANSWDVVPTL